MPSHTLKFALEHILMYEMAGDFTNKYFDYADPTIWSQKLMRTNSFCQTPFINLEGVGRKCIDLLKDVG